MTKKHSLIYRPRGRALEYAPWACNIYSGCDHQCAYCYVPAITHSSRANFAASAPRTGDFLAKLAGEAEKRQVQGIGIGQRVLLSFTCDPYQMLDVDLAHTRKVIQILKSTGHRVEILTKGGLRALRDLDLLGAGDALAATLTCSPTPDGDAMSNKLETFAAPPSQRLAALYEAHQAGVATWASLEPVLDPTQSLDLIKRTSEYVDLFKIGKLNRQRHFDPRYRQYLEQIERKINWQRFALAAIALCTALGKSYYIKNDLAMHLPPTVERASGWIPDWLWFEQPPQPAQKQLL